MDRLTLGDKLVAGGGLALLVLSFLKPWATVSVEGFDVPGASADAGAWDFGILLKGALILAILYAGIVIAKAAGVDLPAMPPVAHVGLGGAVLVLLLIQVLIGPPSDGAELFGVDVSRGLMLFIAIIPAAAVAYGGYLKWQEAESGAGPMGGPAAPPPPPA